MKKTNQRENVIGRISDTLTKVVHGLMAEWQFHQEIKMMGNIEVHLRKHGFLLVELRFPAFFYGAKAHKSSVCMKSKQLEKDLTFQTTRVFILRM